ncbi:calcium-binding protein [Zavarzinia aquatilis]|uniref:Calcium-binding protein n=1 Tax=Zavarzinia aquatilis TaxID=2211142 RepID=A0A317EDP1_9PROT|nr:calcium-binding protein [Zavarzinia aquatilis]PWR25148.1 hypothetical protein DKG74_05125 [Zavarzinia aquatilis]
MAIVNGTPDNDILRGTGDTDELYGFDGADILDGRAGADVMAGGAGDDTYVVDDAGDIAQEADSAGTDKVETSVSYTLGSNIENLRMVGDRGLTATGNALSNTMSGNAADNRLFGLAGDDMMTGGGGEDTLLGGDGDDTLSGNAGNDKLVGGTGNDRLDGGTGDDRMRGGAGDDTYIVDSAGDIVSESGGSGTDTVRSSVSFTLYGGVENLVLTTNGAADGRGNSGANVMIGGAGANSLQGLGGDDTLYGRDGKDTLDGGTGADRMYGGTGNDIYVVDNAGDIVDETGGDGTADLVMTSLATYTLGSGIENLAFIRTGRSHGTGNADANILTGGSGNDTLSGLAGDDTLDGGIGRDTMFGGLGNDTYVVDDIGDVVDESNGGGKDTIRAMLAAFVLTEPKIENLEAGLSIDTSLTGNALNNRLRGNIGNDVLDGGAGKDRMFGGLGDDTYVVDNDGDVVDESNGGGTDTVRTTLAAYTLGEGLENLTLTGSTGSVGTGNELGNIIVGTAGDDTLAGADGDDILIAGSGLDTIVGGFGNDTYVIASVSEFAGKMFDAGTGEIATTDTLRLDAAGAYDWFSAAGLYDIDQVMLNEDAAGWNLTLQYYGRWADEDHDGVKGDLRITAPGPLTHGVTIDSSNGQAALRIDGSQWSGNDVIVTSFGYFPVEQDDIVTGLGADVVALHHFTAGSTIDGTWQAATDDILRLLSSAESYDLTTGAVRNFDILEIGANRGTTSVVLSDQLLSTADANHDGVGGDLLIRGNTGIGDSTSFDLSAVSGGAIKVDATNLRGSELFVMGAARENLVGGLGGDTFDVSLAGLQAGDRIDGTQESGTRDTIRLNGAGTFDFAGVAIANIDRYSFATDDGASLIVSADMAAGGDYDMSGSTRSDIGLTTAVTLAKGITVDLSAMAAGQRFTMQASDGHQFNGDDLVIGGAGTNSIETHGGDDVIIAGLGSDLVYAGDGDDTYVYTVGAQGSDGFYGGNGFDTFRLDQAGIYNGVNGTNVERVLLSDSAAGFDVTLGTSLQDGDGDGDGLPGGLLVTSDVVMTEDVIIRASSYGEGIVFDGATFRGNDTIYGGRTKDVIFGGAGDDTIEGRIGGDRLTGGAGRDVFVYSSALDGFQHPSFTNTGDHLVDFDAGTSTTSVDRLAFDADGTNFSLYIGDRDLKVEGFRTGDNAALNVWGTEIAVKTDAAVTNETIQSQIDTLGNLRNGLIYVAFNSSAGVNKAQVWYDDSPWAAGGAVLMANIDTITSLAGLASIDASDFLFV